MSYNIKSGINTEETYKILLSSIEETINSETDETALFATISALIYNLLENLNWAGFYFIKPAQNKEVEFELVVGPYQGRPACIRLAPDCGVCAAAVAGGRVVRVGNVHDFPGHIACDSASNSEIVLPIRNNGLIIGVLDIDSPLISRFSEEDEIWLIKIVKIIEKIFHN